MMVPALLKRFEPHIRDFYPREYGSERAHNWLLSRTKRPAAA
jgi:hypothetical protein